MKQKIAEDAMQCEREPNVSYQFISSNNFHVLHYNMFLYLCISNLVFIIIMKIIRYTICKVFIPTPLKKTN